jgi:hypothetical protein
MPAPPLFCIFLVNFPEGLEANGDFIYFWFPPDVPAPSSQRQL